MIGNPFFINKRIKKRLKEKSKIELHKEHSGNVKSDT